MNMEIDYKQLAKALREYELEQEHALTEVTKEVVGTIADQEQLDEYKRIIKEERGIDLVVQDLARMRAEIEYRKSAWWDHVYRTIGIERSAAYQMDLETGDVYQVAHGYEEILRKYKAEKIRDQIIDEYA